MKVQPWWEDEKDPENPSVVWKDKVKSPPVVWKDKVKKKAVDLPDHDEGIDKEVKVRHGGTGLRELGKKYLQKKKRGLLQFGEKKVYRPEDDLIKKNKAFVTLHGQNGEADKTVTEDTVSESPEKKAIRRIRAEQARRNAKRGEF